MKIRKGKFKDKNRLKELNIAFKEGSEFLIAEHCGKVVGYIAWNPKVKVDRWFGKHIEIEKPWVEEEKLGEGIAAELLNEVKEIAKRKKLRYKIL